MTNKDAIKWIKAIKEKYIHGGDESFDECRNEALDMAIKALEKTSWIPYIPKNYGMLENHNYYLIAHKYYKTPIKAKFHLDGLPHFEFYDMAGDWCVSYYDVTHFMMMPDSPYKEETA